MNIQHILIVDDSLETCKIFTDLISNIRVECNIESTISIKKAKTKICTLSEHFDIAIIDLDFGACSVDYQGKYAGIGLIKFIMDNSPETLILPYSAHSFGDPEIQEEFLKNIGHLRLERLKENFIVKGNNTEKKKILEKLITEDTFEYKIYKKVKYLSKEQVQLLAWRCALRVLPFLGAEGNFISWNALDRQKHLYSIFFILDIAANKKDETFGIAFDAIKNAMEVVSQEKTPLVNIIIKMANVAANFLPMYYDYLPFAIASAMAYSCHVIGGNEKFHLAIFKDIDSLQKGVTPISKEIYGDVWDNFTQALEKEECRYWKDLIMQFFEDGYAEEEALQLRLNVPKQIRDKGAIWVGEYLKDQESRKFISTEPIQKRKVFISYNHKDKDYAFKVRDELKKEGFEVIIDEDAMITGFKIEEFIKKSIRESGVTVSIVSENSLLSAWVAMETIYSSIEKDLGSRYFIPCKIDDKIFDRRFPDIAIDKIEEELQEIDSIIQKRLKKGRGIEDLTDERTRFNRLKNEMTTIIGNFKGSFCRNISNGYFNEGMNKIIQELHFAEDINLS